ncbi:Cytochrome P450 [Macrophomina phaseolina MS6]|uniref:Cytochrome P450 n=1 Tax=Macrophomina phaseolina (strain MS6) TaxID=1126212 RepID=K2RHV9_MACPH|nr:Cytochrome P450 [Macrophomina phaseolina MS6]
MLEMIYITAYLSFIALLLSLTVGRRLESSLDWEVFSKKHLFPHFGHNWFSKSPLAIFLHWDRWFVWEWLSGLRYLVSGTSLILDAYKPGVVFSLPTPETKYLHFSSEAHVKELVSAPRDVLSLHALSKELLQPKYTMDGLVVEDGMSANGIVHLRVLGVMLRNRLNELHSRLRKTVSQRLSSEISNGTPKQDGWVELPLFQLAKKVIAAGNSSAFFGDEVAHDHHFVEAALRYPEELFTSAEILRLIPGWTVGLVAPILRWRSRASKLMIERLRPLVEQRMEDFAKDPQGDRHVDCLEFFVEASRTKDPWSAQKILQVILGVWFASVHQPALALVYALDDLCRHPEYIGLLRQDLEDFAGGRASPKVENIPLLDSFLKESARLHPSEAISVRRQAVEPFRFSDGTFVRAGQVACVPLNAIMRDPQRYHDSLAFDGGRFVEQGKADKASKFCLSNTDYPLWGLGDHTCPGRFYAARILKTAVAEILLDFDIKFPEGQEESRYFNWRSSTIPYAKTSLLFRKRRDRVPA